MSLQLPKAFLKEFWCSSFGWGLWCFAEGFGENEGMNVVFFVVNSWWMCGARDA
jgi:hypothetical protein